MSHPHNIVVYFYSGVEISPPIRFRVEKNIRDMWDASRLRMCHVVMGSDLEYDCTSNNLIV